MARTGYPIGVVTAVLWSSTQERASTSVRSRDREETPMWDTVHHPDERHEHLSHDRPCQRCGHALHTYLACGDGCDCPPVALPNPARVA